MLGPTRSLRRLAPPALSVAVCVGCIGGSVGVRSHYQSPEPEPAPAPSIQLVSAHLTRFGIEPTPLRGSPQESPPRERLVEGGELDQDSVLLVFTEELDPLTLSPFAFAVLRADGRRVRPTRAFLGPSDEGDENRSVTLLGNFGSESAPPVAVHVIGPIYTEAGAELHGLDANVTPPSEPDRPVLIERLEPNESRCPGSAQMIRSYWTDALTHVGADDLAGVELRLADGRIVHPSEFDDQARREDDPPCPEPFTACLGPADDNVLDLCLDVADPVVQLRFAAGLFRDPSGIASAAADVALPAPTAPRTKS